MTETSDVTREELSPATDDCAAFQEQMPDRIGAGEDLKNNPHLLTCERCQALVQELQYIAEAARQLFPIEIEPREDLWAQIQLAIERGELPAEEPKSENPG